MDALEALARADASWQIVLIGPVKSGQVDETRLRRYPNIHLLGEKPRAALPAYLKGLAVALIPYRANELTRNIFPLKLYEYLAPGCPVVSAALPELAGSTVLIVVRTGPSDYPGLVRRALAEDGAERRRARVALRGGTPGTIARRPSRPSLTKLPGRRRLRSEPGTRPRPRAWEDDEDPAADHP